MTSSVPPPPTDPPVSPPPGGPSVPPVPSAPPMPSVPPVPAAPPPPSAPPPSVPPPSVPPPSVPPPSVPPPSAPPLPANPPEAGGRCYPGKAASQGTALGVLHRADRPRSRHALPRRGAGDPVQQVADAFDAVAARLRELSESLRERHRDEQADIMDVNARLALDPDFRDRAIGLARNGTPAAVAVRQSMDACAEDLGTLEDPTIAERAADVRQVGRRVLAWLYGDPEIAPDRPLVLVAHEIGAADLLDPGREVVAAASVTGGHDSHAAIVARSLGIPLLLEVEPRILELPDGEEILLDTERSAAVTHPDEAERAAVHAVMDAARARRITLAGERHLPAETLDRYRVTVCADIASRTDAKTALEAEPDGIGLLRTEPPFLTARTWPTRRQHAAALTPVLRRLTGQTVIARTLDFPDDELPPFLSRRLEHKSGRRLGRGLPLMLAEPDAFADQFRSLLQAATGSDLRIVVPAVADVAELRACRRLLETAADELDVRAVPLGVVVELPEAVAAADSLAREADFLAIGSDGLTRRILGLQPRDLDAAPALAAHPAVLRAIAGVVAAAHRHHRRVSVTGSAAAHPLVAPLLIGLGCDSLSVAPAGLDEIRARIRRIRHDTSASVAETALVRDSPEDVWHLVQQHCLPLLP